MVKVDILGGNPLVNCPFPDSSLPPNPSSNGLVLHYPTLSLTYFVFFVSFAIQGFRILLQYNNVKIFNRQISHPSVKNWELYLMFFALSASTLIDGIRYSLNLPIYTAPDYVGLEEEWIAGPHVIDAWLLLASGILRSVGLLFLSLGLYRQAIHRSIISGCETDVEEDVFISPASATFPAEDTPLLESSVLVPIEEGAVTEEEAIREDEYLSRNFIFGILKTTKSALTSIRFLIWLIFGLRVFLMIIST
jgi:hypothetical protein